MTDRPVRVVDAAERRTTSPSINSLTGIRGVAALWVMMTHYQAVLSAYLHDPTINDNSFLYNGFRGVDLFFVLSGFILMHVHGEEFRRHDRETLERFYLLRFFRVYPLNTVVLLALLPLPLVLPGLVDWFRFDHGVPVPYHGQDFSPGGFVQSVLLAQTWTLLKLGEWNGPAWSLSAEVFGYALFPFLANWIVQRNRAITCIAGALVSLSVLIMLLIAFHHTQDSPTGTFGLIRMLFGFIAGMFMARCFALLPHAALLGERVIGASVLAIVAALSISWANMLVVFGFCGLIFGLAYQKGPVDALFSSRPIMFLGRVSFSLYMIHYVPLKASLWLLQVTPLSSTGLWVRVLFLAGLLLFCVGLAVAVHEQIERRFQRVARRILRRRKSAAEQARPGLLQHVQRRN